MIHLGKTILIFIFLSYQAAFAQKMVFVFLHYRSDKAELPKEQIDKIMDGHMANIQAMAKDGKLLVAGPFEGGGGIFIFNTPSTDSVTLWLKDDPGVQANRWKIEIMPYLWRVGKPRLVGEPIEMTTYQFIRYLPRLDKFHNNVTKLFKKHNDYLKRIERETGVVCEGIFGETEGGIIVINGELDRKIIESDPAIHQGLLEIEIKKWYVAKGAFGEK